MKHQSEIDRRIAYRRFIQIVSSKQTMNNLQFNQEIVTQYLKPENR